MRLNRKRLRKLILQEIKKNLLKEDNDQYEEFQKQKAIAGLAPLQNFTIALTKLNTKIKKGTKLYDAIVRSIKNSFPVIGRLGEYGFDAHLLSINQNQISKFNQEMSKAYDEDIDMERYEGLESSIYVDQVLDRYKFNPKNYSYEAEDICLVIPGLMFEVDVGKQFRSRGSLITLSELISSNPSGKGLMQYDTHEEPLDYKDPYSGEQSFVYGTYVIKISGPRELLTLFELYGIDLSNPSYPLIPDSEYEEAQNAPDKIQIGDGEEGPIYGDYFDDQ